jgi:hypothetical protein
MAQEHKMSLFLGKGGYQARCLCGWVGRLSASRDYAQQDGNDHMTNKER